MVQPRLDCFQALGIKRYTLDDKQAIRRGGPMPLFDAYVFIDWSAATGAQPQQPTAVWVGELISCRYLQFDEIWGFIGKKQRHLTPEDDPTCGDVWTFCAIDAETKIVPSFKVGKRDLATAKIFVNDVAGRLKNRVQISSDGLRAYADSIEQTFGADVDYGQLIKTYTADSGQHPERKYSTPRISASEKLIIAGKPNTDFISTSYVERLNATNRTHIRRLTRLTLAFSKKLENFEAAVALHFAYYNFVKFHKTLRCTPAMAANVETSPWTVGDLVEAAG